MIAFTFIYLDIKWNFSPLSEPFPRLRRVMREESASIAVSYEVRENSCKCPGPLPSLPILFINCSKQLYTLNPGKSIQVNPPKKFSNEQFLKLELD